MSLSEEEITRIRSEEMVRMKAQLAFNTAFTLKLVAVVAILIGLLTLTPIGRWLGFWP
jgi:hypothetical protein